jgi:hypothetical protein
MNKSGLGRLKCLMNGERSAGVQPQSAHRAMLVEFGLGKVEGVCHNF